MAPTLKLDQVRIAFCVFWTTVTVVWPLLLDCDGRLAPCHTAGSLVFGATCSPPGAKPFGTLPLDAAAALRAAAWVACIAWMARIAAESELRD